MTAAQRSFILTALWLIAACAPPGGRAATGALPDSEVQRYARLLAMADARELDTGLVNGALRSRSSAMRSAAALAVGQVRGRDMAGRLRLLLADSDTAVAANAAYALGLLRDTASIGALEDALVRPPSVGAEAAWALGEVGELARISLVRALSSVRTPRVAGPLLLAAAKLRPAPVAATTPFLRHADPEIRWRAAYVVARPYEPAGVRALLGHARDEVAAVRAQVARALSRQAAGDSLRTPALAALATLVRDRDPHVRINALRALATYGRAAREYVVTGVRDPDANVRVTAAQSLGDVLGSERDAWNDAWNADTSLMYRKSVLASAVRADAALAAIHPENPDRWQRLPDWRQRSAVAEAAAEAASARHVAELALPLIDDPDGRVRTAAFAAIGPFADSTAQREWRREVLLPALQDWDPAARATVLNALVGRARASEVALVLESYRRADRDTLSDARQAAIRYLAAAWRRDSAAFSDSLRQALAKLPLPADPLVRTEAAGISPLSHWHTTAGTGRPIDWYEERVRRLVLPALRGRHPMIEIVTVRGPIVLELFARDAPLTVDNFLSLVRAGYYDALRFHRVVPNFVAQDGDPRGDGNGGPGYAIRDELNRRRYDRGVIGMALYGPDTGGSQYFLTLSPQPHLDGGYTAFGRVVDGFRALDALVQGDLVDSVRVRGSDAARGR